VPTRFEVRRFTTDDVGEAAHLLAERHKRHRLACPALNPAYEDAEQCAPLILELLATDGSLGAIASRHGKAAGYVLTTPRDDSWGPNAWAEDAGSAGEAEAIRESYAAIAGELVAEGRKGHWAMVPPTDAELIEGWFSLSFGRQQIYAYQRAARPDFQLSIRPGLAIRRADLADAAQLAELDLVLPRHTQQSPVFSTRAVPTIEEALADVPEYLGNEKYKTWVAEHGGRVISALTGLSVDDTDSWSAMMRPVSAGLLGFAATLPEARGLGAARALAQTFMAWSRDEGYEWLVTDWRSTNLEGNRAWRAMGFEPFFDRLHRAIA
jgi:ribosomal protein S18 acetylase RimI-like enzyme